MSTATTRPTISAWEEALWALAAFVHLAGCGALGEPARTPAGADERAAADVLVASGLATWDPDGKLALSQDVITGTPPGTDVSTGVGMIREATMSALGQVAQIVGITNRVVVGATDWAVDDDATLLAQGRASARGGQMLADVAVPMLPGLAESFATGGALLDVGTGVVQFLEVPTSPGGPAIYAARTPG